MALTWTRHAVVFNIRRWWDAANPYHVGRFVYFEALFGGFRGDPDCLITDGPVALAARRCSLC